MGIRDQATKSASDILQTFKEILLDINDVSKDKTTEAGKLILSNLKNTCQIGLPQKINGIDY